MTNTTKTEQTTTDARMMMLIDAKDETTKAAEQPGLSNETFQFLLGMKVGLERAIGIMEAK
ncbi:MAG: hypothetical protein NTY38_11130 [Acidobacteria bacterium]|nr:hypothetical protein [Acidobacteriota bacterium]